MDRSFGAVVFSPEDEALRYLLVLHGRGGHWGLPKGHPRPGETPLLTVRREVLEETGYRIRLLDGFYERIQYDLPSGRRKQVDYYLAEALAREPEPPPDVDPGEIAQTEWLTLGPALDRITHGDVKAVLAAADRFLLQRGSSGA